ncbi:40S ribosomal protein S12 [Claviceps digitariae]|nr:40S ribosomal protein S12 [Claviceps digitariae]
MAQDSTPDFSTACLPEDIHLQPPELKIALLYHDKEAFVLAGFGPLIARQDKFFKMSDVEENNAPAEVEVSADAPKGQMSVLDALKGVLKLALMHDGLARGLREASKALDRRQAHMCVLNENCEEDAYKKLVAALCDEHKIPLIKVQDGKQLGEWAGLCVLDREGNARKVVNCSCVVVKDWGEESQERSILLNYFQTSS